MVLKNSIKETKRNFVVKQKRKKRKKEKKEKRKKGKSMHYAPGTINFLEQSKLVCDKCIMLLKTLMLSLYLEDTSCFFFMFVIVRMVKNVS
jgi:hypothetical protein